MCLAMKTPDWKNKADYAITNELSYAGWAWEFLRRSETYQQAWKQYSDSAAKLEEEFGEGWRANKEAWCFEPPREKGESIEVWCRRSMRTGHGDSKFSGPLNVLAAREFHLVDMHSPLRQFDCEVRFFEPVELPARLFLSDDFERFVTDVENIDPVDGHVRDIYTAVDDQYGVIVFDLGRELNAQWKVAKNLLLENGGKIPRKPKIQAELWTSYLRMLDGKRLGATNADLADVFFPDPGPNDHPEEQVAERLKKAGRYCKLGQIDRLITAHFQTAK